MMGGVNVKKVKRIIATLLCMAILCSVLPADILTSYAEVNNANANAPTPEITYAISEMNSLDELTNDGNISVYSEGTGTYKAIEDGVLKLGTTSGLNRSIVILNPYNDTTNDLIYPVTGVKGEMQLGQHELRNGSVIFFAKDADQVVTDEATGTKTTTRNYAGNTVNMYPTSDGLILRRNYIIGTYTKTVSSNGSVSESYNSVHTQAANLKLDAAGIAALITTNETEQATIKAELQAVTELSNQERWVEYELGYTGGNVANPYLALQLNINDKVYDLQLPLVNFATTTYTDKACALGASYHQSSGVNHASNNQTLFGDFTVSYDISSFYADVIDEFKQRVDALGYLTYEDYEGLTQIYQQYQTLSQEEQSYINIERVENAIQAFDNGAYFYDDFEGNLNWKIASKITGTTYDDNLTETNIYSADTVTSTGNDAGEAFWGIHTDSQDINNHALWLRKSFSENNILGSVNTHRRQPSVTAITKPGILPEDAKIAFVKGRMYVNHSNISNERNFASVQLSYMYESEYNWQSVGINYEGTLNGGIRTSETQGHNYWPHLEGNYSYEGTLTEFASNQWVDFELKYNPSYGCYVFAAKGLDDQGEKVSWEVQMPNGTKPMSQVALLHTNNVKQSFDDIAIGLMDSNYAKNYIDALPDATDVTLEDENQILMVKNIIELLSDADKAQVPNMDKYHAVYATYQYLIDEREGNLLLENTISFEDEEPGKNYFESVNAAGAAGWLVTNNPDKSGDNQTDKVLKITKNYMSDQDAGNNRAVYKLKDTVLDGEHMLANFSGKVYLDSASTATVIYEYKNENNWRGYQIAVSGKTLTYSNVTKNGVGDLTISKATQLLYLGATPSTLPQTGIWVSYNIDYTMTKVLLTLKFEYNGQQYITRSSAWTTMGDSCITKVGLATGTQAYFDDIRVNFQGTEGYVLTQRFVKAYENLLKLIPTETYVSITDGTAISDMHTEYEAFSENVKTYIPFMDVRIVQLQTTHDNIDAASEASKRDIQMLADSTQQGKGYKDYIFEDGFEQGLSAWQPIQETKLNTGDVTTVYHEKFGSNVVKLMGQSLITPKLSLLPDKAQVMSVSYKIYRDPNETQHPNFRLRVYASYIDEDDTRGYGFYRASETAETNARHFYTGLQGRQSTSALNMNTVWTVKIEYDAYGSYTITVTDEEGTKVEFPTQKGSAKSSMVIGAFFGTNDKTSAVYVDDIKIEYQEGNYDYDTVNEEITVYYSGNTFQTAGDYVTLSGENLANNVTQVWIAPLSDGTTTSNKGFVSQERFDTLGAKKGDYSADPVEHHYDEELGVQVNIVQKTTDSIKFKIPSEYADGSKIDNAVYAVRLIGVGRKSRIIYMNNPYIDYAVGSDGEISSPGEEVRIIGKNLAPTGKAEDIKAVFVSEDKAITEAIVTKVQSMYSISVRVPDTLKKGSYELWLHSGKGDDTAWAVPIEIKVDAPIRDAWPDEIFSVADYGATGESNQNATPYIINALSAIAANGGGVLYFPRGSYTIQTELYIPENCRIIGEDAEATTIAISPYNMAIGNLRDVFYIKGNVEFSNIRIAASRVANVWQIDKQQSENLYFNNVFFYAYNRTGRPDSGMVSTYTALLEPAELYALLLSEGSGGAIMNYGTSRVKNLRINHVDFTVLNENKDAIVVNKGGSSHWYLNEFDSDGGWTQAYTSNSIWENSETGPNNCIAFWGDGCYMQNVTFKENARNNRELYVGDGGVKSTLNLTPVEGDETNTKFIADYTFTAGEAAMGQVYIRDGQGVGQTRTIKAVEHVTNANGKKQAIITINTPFHIKPNRSSSYVVRLTRENIYFVDNSYYMGTACGFYGGAADVVYDNCSFEGVHNIYQRGRKGDVNFYFSIINCDVQEATSLGTAGTGSEKNALGFEWESAEGAHSQMYFLLRDCEINGLTNGLSSASTDGMVDVIIQRNEWSDVDYAFSIGNNLLGGATKYENFDGVLMVDNDLINVDSLFDTTEQSTQIMELAMKTTNTSGSKRVMILDEIPSYAVLGDVNGDGVANLKDATLISYYVVGKIELSDEQLTIGDVDGDGNTNLRDASLIKLKVAGKIELFPVEEKKEDNQ